MHLLPLEIQLEDIFTLNFTKLTLVFIRYQNNTE